MMYLSKQDDTYNLRTTYEEKDLPKKLGFAWDGREKVWWTKSSEKAAQLIKYDVPMNRELKVELTKVLVVSEHALEDSRAISSLREFPKPEGLEYLPFQKAGIAYALDRKGVIIGDEMGLGKTIQAIGVINSNPRPSKVLVVCPASIKINWKRELEKWLTHKLRVTTVSTKELGWELSIFKQYDVLVINYNILEKASPEFESTVFDYLIVDECHYVKNPKAKRSKQVFAIKSRRQLYMTGTPIVNRPKELWPILHALDPGTWKNFFTFGMRYCAGWRGEWGWDFSGASNLEELQEKLRSTLLIRRLKRDVLTELPPKVRQVIELPANGSRGLIDDEWESYEDHKSQIESLQERVAEAALLKDVEDYREAVRALNTAQLVAFNMMAKLRHDTAVAKLPMVIEHLEDSLEAGNKVVVFAHHHDVVDSLKSHFDPICVVVDGRVKPDERMALVDKFQNQAEVRLFIGSITAAGVGITLTAATHVVFAELDWVPGNLSQAEDRLHRIGQRGSVLVQHLVLEESLDAYMAKRIVKKQEIIERALDVVGEMYVLPTKEDVEEFVAKRIGPRKSTIVDHILAEKGLESKKRMKSLFDTGIENIPARRYIERSPEFVDAVKKAVKFLADRCDGARSIDGGGFSKLDTEFGKSLASKVTWKTWTPPMVESGFKLAFKYRKQLSDKLLQILHIERGRVRR